VDVADNRGWQPLHEAAAGNYIRCLEFILQTGLCYVHQSQKSTLHLSSILYFPGVV